MTGRLVVLPTESDAGADLGADVGDDEVEDVGAGVALGVGLDGAEPSGEMTRGGRATPSGSTGPCAVGSGSASPGGNWNPGRLAFAGAATRASERARRAKGDLRNVGCISITKFKGEAR